MYSPNLWILNMFCLSSHFPKPWKDRTFPNRLQKQDIFPALSGSLETQVHKLHDGICRKIKRTPGDSRVFFVISCSCQTHTKRRVFRQKVLKVVASRINKWLLVGHKNAHILKSNLLDSLDVHHQQLGSWRTGGLEPSSWETTETIWPMLILLTKWYEHFSNALKPPGHLSRHRLF